MTPKTWLSTRLVGGHGVASGRSPDTPYPAGTIAMQRPVFKQLGLDLSVCWPGTLNLSVAPLELRLHNPDHCFPLVEWTDRHPPETFSFWTVQIETPWNGVVQGWIYQPHPETKAQHHQPASMVEVLAPHLDGLETGSVLRLHDPLRRLECINPVRLKARLLEFLKFRVLAAQEDFFRTTASVQERRAWLTTHHREALQLHDAQLDQVWQQARSLYTEN